MDDTTAIIVGALIAGIAIILNEYGNEEVEEVIEGWNHLSVLLFFNSSFINIYNYDRVIDIFRRQTSASAYSHECKWFPQFGRQDIQRAFQNEPYSL